MTYDFSSAQPSNFDAIPAKTRARILLNVLAGDAGSPEDLMAVTKGGLYQLVLECTVLDGQYAKRKFWQRLTMGAQPGVQLTEGQKTGVDISGSTIRSILEQVRHISPTDDSEAAVRARKMTSLMELDGVELDIEVGLEKDKTGQYPDKNKIGRILPATKAAGSFEPGNVTAAPKASPRTNAWA